MNNHDAILKEREQANFWKLKCLEYIRELQKANKGIRRLRRRIESIKRPTATITIEGGEPGKKYGITTLINDGTEN